jgi:hypothetical protein
MRKKNEAVSLPTVAKVEGVTAKGPSERGAKKATKPKKSASDRFIETIAGLLALEDSEVPQKLQNWLGAAFNPGDSQKIELFKKFNEFCKKYWKLFEKLSKTNPEITVRNSKITLEFCEKIEPNEEDGTVGCPDTVFVEKDSTGFDITAKGIIQADGVDFQDKKVFINDEKDLAAMLKITKEILKHYAAENKTAANALLDLQKTVKVAIGEVSETLTKEKENNSKKEDKNEKPTEN